MSFRTRRVSLCIFSRRFRGSSRVTALEPLERSAESELFRILTGEVFVACCSKLMMPFQNIACEIQAGKVYFPL